MVSSQGYCNKVMARYRLNLADMADDDHLRAILAATSMPGRVTVGFQREPSYFGAAVVDGRFRQVVAARDAASNRLVGFGSRSVLDRYVNGSAMPIGYLSNLRVLPEHRRGPLVARGYAFLRKLHEDRRTSLYLTTIAQDNQTAMKVLATGRAGLPVYHPAGRYVTTVLPLACRRNRRTSETDIAIRPAREGDVSAILSFLGTHGPRRQFFPCYEPQDFFTESGLLRGLRPEDLLLALRGNHLVGTLAAWDQRAFRQMVVSGYGKPLCWLRPLYNGWASLGGRPHLPRPGVRMRCLMGALPVVSDDDPAVFRALLDALIQKRSGRAWDYLLLGMHESDQLLPSLEERATGRYTTQVFLACWEDGEGLCRSLDGRPLYLELGSL
jgi:hypothetical protein